MARGWREGYTIARSYPRQLDSRSLIHCHGRAARIPEDNLPAFHFLRDSHVVSGREEASRVAVEYIAVARPVHVDPAFQAELILLLALLRTKMIEEGLDVLLHLIAELFDDRLLELEKIERVVPPPAVRTPGRVAVVLHKPPREILQSLVQVPRPVLAQVDPRRKQRHHADLTHKARIPTKNPTTMTRTRLVCNGRTAALSGRGFAAGR